MSAPAAVRATISILTSGAVKASQFAALLPLFVSVEQVTVDGDPSSGSLMNRCMDGAANDWILLLHDREVVSEALAREMAAAVGTQAAIAWGYRIRTVVTYEGEPLDLPGMKAGEVRLFHRRHSRFDVRTSPSNLNVQGTVVRMTGALLKPTFESREEHESFLAGRGGRRAFPMRVLTFLANALRTGALWKGKTSRRYMWVESGWKVKG